MLEIRLCPRNGHLPLSKFHWSSFTGSLPPNMWNITFLWLFYCHVLVTLFYWWSRPGRTPGRILLVIAPRSNPWTDFTGDRAQIEPLDGFYWWSRPGRTPGRILLVIAPRSNPWTDFNRLRLKWRVVTPVCSFCGFGWWPALLRGSNRVQTPQNPEKGGVVRHFPAKLANTIGISPAGKIESTPNFDKITEPHSWLRVWSRIAKLKFKMADGRHIAKCWKH